MSKYGTIITTAGREAMAQALANGTKVRVAEIAVGDGGGKYYVPDPEQTALKGEKWRGSVANGVWKGEYCIVAVRIPADVGGFTIREMAAISSEGIVMAIAVVADMVKPDPSEGMAAELRPAMTLAVSQSESVEIVLDSNTVTATLKDLEAHNTDPDAHKELLDGLRPYEFATTEEAVAGENEDKIMSPKRVKESVLSNAPAPDIDGAITDRIATSAEAGAGTDDTKLMTPKKVKEVVSSIDTAYIRKDTNAALPVDWLPGALSIGRPATDWKNNNTFVEGTRDTGALAVGNLNKVEMGNNAVFGSGHIIESGLGCVLVGFCNELNQYEGSANNMYDLIVGHQNTASGISKVLMVGIYNEADGKQKNTQAGTNNSLCVGSSNYLYNASNSILAGAGNETISYGKNDPDPAAYHTSCGFAFGNGLITAGGCFIIGNHNKIPVSAVDYKLTYNQARDSFVVGNGTSRSKSNAFRVSSTGAVYGTGAYNTSGADYAEYFEWQDGNPDNGDRRGRFVTLEGEKIRFAQPGEYVLGVVSAAPSVVGDAASEDWQGKYERDVFGQILYGEDGARKLNPAFKPEDDAAYTGREKRKEWAAVGMMGKLAVVDDGSCQVNGYCQPGADGIAVSAKTGYRVIARLDDTHVKIVVK